jgi:hypothetical protein
MVNRVPRLLLAFAALLLASGSVMHAAAFNKILSAVTNSNLVPFAANSLKALWIADSATCLILAAIFGFVAARPGAATRWVIVLLGLVPLATAALIYKFIGPFIGGHILIVSAAAAIAGGLQLPRATSSLLPTIRTRFN